MTRAGAHVFLATALAALLLAGGAAAADDAASALVEMMSGDVSLLSDDSLSSLFLALTEASRSPQTMQAIQTVSGSSPAPTPGTEAAAAGSTTAGSSSSSGSEAALMGDLFSALFTGADSPISTFLSAAGNGGVSSQLAALLGPSSSAAASVASTGGIPTLRSSLGSLLGTTTSTGGATSSSNPFSALLQPVASTRSIMSQLAEAVEQANSVLAAPHWDDLFGGVDLTRFLSSNRTVLREAMVAMEEMEEHVCKHPYIEWGKFVPSHCDGHNITLAIDGGSCTISHKDHSVTCRPPSVRLIKTPATCTKKHTTPVRVVGKECKIVKRFGDTKQGLLKAPANKTVVLDFSEPTAPQLVRNSPTASTGSSKSSKRGVASRLAAGLAALKERLPRWTKK